MLKLPFQNFCLWCLYLRRPAKGAAHVDAEARRWARLAGERERERERERESLYIIAIVHDY